VQDEMKRRRGEAKYRHGNSCFAGRIVCGECGGFYGSKVWHSNDPYRCVIWRCNRKYDGEKKCATPHVREEDIKAAFVEAINGRLACKDEVLAGVKVALASVMDMSIIDDEAQRIKEQILGVAQQLKGCIERNARVAQDQATFDREYGALESRHAELNSKLQGIESRRGEQLSRRREIEAFIGALEACVGPVAWFDEGLWRVTVKKAVIDADGGIHIVLVA